MNDERGEKALELIADYPLYASTSGITYDQAIEIAIVLFGEDFENEEV